ncbi:MAG: CDP-alcohol phosphatidyltransferase family protein [Hydrogenophaga sp.]|uniref:CDP-alcohol phosphatidyltransferase family protein n=1 Tax=Hydrogenophaga sp. TaxID=1904254 RepID=UPI003D0EACDB
MFDATLNQRLKSPLQAVALRLLNWGLKADHLTWVGFVIGLLSVPLIALGMSQWALITIFLNRLADGLDGTMARLTQPTDRGAFLDIALDFLFYASIPMAFALAKPEQHALASTVLLFSFVGTGSSFLAFAVLAAQRGLSSVAYAGKGIYYLGGLSESTETITVFVLMCLWPEAFSVLAYGFSALCALTILTRIATGMQVFRPD